MMETDNEDTSVLYRGYSSYASDSQGILYNRLWRQPTLHPASLELEAMTAPYVDETHEVPYMTQGCPIIKQSRKDSPTEWMAVIFGGRDHEQSVFEDGQLARNIQVKLFAQSLRVLFYSQKRGPKNPLQGRLVHISTHSYARPFGT